MMPRLRKDFKGEPRWRFINLTDGQLDGTRRCVLQCQPNDNTDEVIGMKTISLKVTERLHRQLERTARERGQSKSEIVRAALGEYLNGKRAPRPGSALEAAGPWVGCVEGPGDLA